MEYCAVWYGRSLPDVSEMLLASIFGAMMMSLMMEAQGTFETSVNFYQSTRRNNPEDSHLHTLCGYVTVTNISSRK
jgi:hypothetical protein